jgi:hypothetical protein
LRSRWRLAVKRTPPPSPTPHLLYFCAELRANLSGRVRAPIIKDNDLVAELGIVVKDAFEVTVSFVAGEQCADDQLA